MEDNGITVLERSLWKRGCSDHRTFHLKRCGAHSVLPDAFPVGVVMTTCTENLYCDHPDVSENCAVGKLSFCKHHANTVCLYSRWQGLAILGTSCSLSIAACLTFFATESLHGNQHICILAEQVAFSSVSIALQHFQNDMLKNKYHIHYGVIEKRPGSAPNDWAAFTLSSHIALPINE